jgi:hypothetical protein
LTFLSGAKNQDSYTNDYRVTLIRKSLGICILVRKY